MAGSGDHFRRDALRTVGDGRGCEATAARAFQRGRLQVAEVDMWKALGLTPPGLPPLAKDEGSS